MTIRSPGEIISSDILPHMNVRPSELAVAMGMSPASISRILTGKAAITPETAIRLEKVLNEKADFWMSLQTSYDLARARTTVDVTSLAQLEAKPGLHSARALLKNIFERYVGTDRSIPLTDLVEVTELCGVEPLFMLMRQVDPERKLFDYPATKMDRGIHGLPLLEGYFKTFSFSEDCGILDEDNLLSQEFIASVYKTFSGDFHGHALVAYDYQLKTEGVLVWVLLNKKYVPISADMLALQETINAPVSCYVKPGRKWFGEGFLLTAFIADKKRLSPLNLNVIRDELKGLAAKWRNHP
ncbi:HigA family addiction module antitoxin [Pseudomonas serbica]|uniref:HigA family addiction module antitoxin n=1 Tax=Pseudomonas serbica TaxID=2965074 RepID=UPI00237B27DA|nr:HigA family addiction module antitoxin [Pseudomonas serbica]